MPRWTKVVVLPRAGRRVATSYPRLVANHLASFGITADVVRLDGAVVLGHPGAQHVVGRDARDVGHHHPVVAREEALYLFIESVEHRREN